MTEFLDLVTSWQMLVLVLSVYGIVPGAALRAIVLLYPSGDPRRRELLAELYGIPHKIRPIWVAQQLETAFFDGLVPRLSKRLSKKGAARRLVFVVLKLGVVGFGVAGVIGGGRALASGAAESLIDHVNVDLGMIVVGSVGIFVGVFLLMQPRISTAAAARIRKVLGIYLGSTAVVMGSVTCWAGSWSEGLQAAAAGAVAGIMFAKWETFPHRDRPRVVRR